MGVSLLLDSSFAAAVSVMVALESLSLSMVERKRSQQKVRIKLGSACRLSVTRCVPVKSEEVIETDSRCRLRVNNLGSEASYPRNTSSMLQNAICSFTSFNLVHDLHEALNAPHARPTSFCAITTKMARRKTPCMTACKSVDKGNWSKRRHAQLDGC
jgi:hypothetical protein